MFDSVAPPGWAIEAKENPTERTPFGPGWVVNVYQSSFPSQTKLSPVVAVAPSAGHASVADAACVVLPGWCR